MLRFTGTGNLNRDSKMSDYIEEVESSRSSLVDQLATNPKLLARGEIDELKLGYLTSSENIPDQAKPLFILCVLHGIIYEKLSFTASIMKYYPKVMDSINGRNQDITIKAELAKMGGSVSVEAPPQKPSWSDHIVNREKVRQYNEYLERQELGLE